MEEADRSTHDMMLYNCMFSPSSPEALYNGDKERQPEPRTAGSPLIETGQYAKARTSSKTNQ